MKQDQRPVSGSSGRIRALPTERVVQFGRVFVCHQHSLFLGHKKERKTVENLLIIKRFLTWYGRCLESGVRRTKDTNLLPLQSGSKISRRFLLLFLALASTSVFGQGAVMTLAMVRYDQSPARTTATVCNHSAANLLSYDVAPSRLQFQTAALKLDDQRIADFAFDSRLEKQSEPNQRDQRDLLQLVHKKLYTDGRMGKWMDVAAGYGQYCQFESRTGGKAAELERPGFAYLKASFSF